MSKYKSSTSTASSSSSAANQPIWTTLTTPSQIARKYASIAPIWCHISRPRQLKKKFASTLHQAQNLLSRAHSKESSLNSKSNELDDDTDELTSTNTYKNSLTSADIGTSSNYDYSFKKRDSSLDYKSGRKNETKSDPYVPSSSSSYISSYTTNPVSSARWASKPSDNGAAHEDNLTANAEATSGAARRPNKYTSAKYGQQGPSASKTERIISKSSKSSPNLVSKDKDYESFYTDRYEPKWTNSSYNNYVNHGHSQYHSNPTNSYSNYGYNSYSNYSNNDTNYNHYNPSREDKWNELDSMLGAQSALLSRLESDFVANRNKLKTSSNLTTIGSSSNVNSSQYKVPTYASSSKYSGSSHVGNLSSKSHNNMSSITNENDAVSSYVPSRYRTPTKKSTVSTTTSKYTAKIDDLELESQKKVSRKPTSFISTAKTEPLIDLIKTFDLNEPNGKKSDETEDKLLGIEKTLDESINKVLSESMAENFANLAGLASVTALANQSPSVSVPSTPIHTNNHDFVDDFINDYINSTLMKSDANVADLSANLTNNTEPTVSVNAAVMASSNENNGLMEQHGLMNTLALKNEATDNLAGLVSVHETPSWFVSVWRI